MLNLRYKNETNTWPGFVDLFSNLVIILIFLLIVFVFLWTTTSVFNRNSGVKKISELSQINAEQSAQIERMKSDEEIANNSLIQAQDEIKQMEISQTNLSVAYEKQLNDLEAQSLAMQQQIEQLTKQLNQSQDYQNQIQKLEQKIETQSTEYTATIEKMRNQLNEQSTVQTEISQQEIAKLQAALNVAEANLATKNAEYTELSNRLNKALADKVAELQDVAQYQSEFYKSVSNALGNRTVIKREGDRFIISSDILFQSGKYNLSESGKNQLKLLANVIKDFEEKIPSDVNWIIRVDGHTDKKPVIQGTRNYKNNTELSFLRADAVVRELVRDGVSKRRLVPTGFGSTQPVQMGSDAESLKQNRRIELQLTNR